MDFVQCYDNENDFYIYKIIIHTIWEIKESKKSWTYISAFPNLGG